MSTPDKRPYVDGKSVGGQGVSAQRINMGTPDQIPYLHSHSVVGNGVSAQRRQFPINGKKTRGKDIPLAQYEGNVNTPDSIPMIGSGGAFGKEGGRGVSAQRANRPFSENWRPAMKAPRELSSPFPFFGGKSRLATQIWAKLGNPTVYVEPFAGSLACLLARPDGAGQREIVCDLDGGISNFWRAVTADPDLVAYWADFPTFHADLTARHKWLRAWFAEHSAELSNDPHFYCAKVAGWWVWGISLWIGGGWCNAVSERKDGLPNDKIPMTPNRDTHMGVAAHLGKDKPLFDAQRVWDVRPAVTSANGVSAQVQRAHPDKVPHVHHKGGGQGVSAQRLNTPDKRPYAGVTGGGQGVSAQRLTVPDKRPVISNQTGGNAITYQAATRPDLVSWFRAIQERLKGVIVLNRSWESALTPTLLMHTPTAPKPPVGILLDPPYLTVDRQSELYGSDADGSSSDVATAAYAWAIANGDRFRIAYCCHEGDFPVPDGWTFITASFGGVKDAERRASRQDMVMFSPLCVPDEPDPQMTMFDLLEE